MKDLDLGDLVAIDSGDLGIDFYHKDGKKIMFINQASELVMLEWLKEKYPLDRQSPNVLLGNRNFLTNK